MDLDIIQWNSRSLMSNKGSMERLLQKHEIDIAIISETWIKPSQNPPKFAGYNLLTENRSDGKGGCAIILKNALSYSVLNINYTQKILYKYVQLKLKQIRNN